MNRTRRVRQGILSDAKQALDRLGDWPVADEAIHDARKRLKKARAGLRLIRDALGEPTFERENAALRDAARPLSAVRDAKVLVEAYDRLVRRLAPAKRKSLDPLRVRLVASQLAVRGRTLRDGDSLRPVLLELKRLRVRAKRWPSARRGSSAIDPGLRRVYRDGRRAFAEAQVRATDEHLHEWRKQVKYHWHHLQLLERMGFSRLAPWSNRAHELSDRLGDDHDLAVLRGRAQRQRSRLTPGAMGRLVSLIDKRRQRLRAQAIALGHKVYKDRPRAFANRLAAQPVRTKRVRRRT